MERTLGPGKSHVRDGQRLILLGVCLMLSLAAIVMESAPAFGLWLPWASEQDKIKKVVSDVWEGLAANDRALLNKSLTGKNPDWFIDVYRRQIETLGIQKYKCNFDTITIDSRQDTTAYVIYETVATMKDGSLWPSKIMSTVGKVNGEWKLVTDIDPVVQRLLQKRMQADDDASDLTPQRGPLPGVQTDSPRQPVAGTGQPQ